MKTNAMSHAQSRFAFAAAAAFSIAFFPACSPAPAPTKESPVADVPTPAPAMVIAPAPPVIEPVVLEALPPEPEGTGLDDLDAIMLSALTDEPEPAAEPRPSPKRANRTKPRLVAYPFESAFDDGALGAKVAVVITGHAARTGRFDTLPKITQDEIFAGAPFTATADIDTARVSAHARSAFDADVIVWGRVTGNRAKPVLEVKALDLRRKGDALILDKQYRCANIHYVPIFAGEVVAAILGIDPLRPKYATTVRALSGNLLSNGDFRKGLSGWTPAFPKCAKVEGRSLVFTIPKDIASGHGMSVLSEYIPVEQGAHYELSLRVRSHGPSVITWVKGYAQFKARSEGEKLVDSRREVFRHQMRPASQKKPGADGWTQVTTRPFRPRNPKVPVTWMRVKLYGYWPKGVVEFEKVSLVKVEVEGETADEEDARTRRAWGGHDPGEHLEDETP
jgi:hypothetical protein